MPHRLRHDHPGSWHHVFARGIARRTVFESERDIRVFKCLLALEVRRGTLEVHVLVFMTTHVHMLLRSPIGELSAALKRVFAAYVRWFNRTRRRDGSLFRGRFGSRPVTSDLDRLNVTAYADANPLEARLAPSPMAYAHGSARYWAGARVPPWFSTSFIARSLGVTGPQDPRAWERYVRVLAPRTRGRLARLQEARLAHGHATDDALDDLVGAAPPRVLAWMTRKAALADQTKPGLPVADVETVEDAWGRVRGLLAGSVRGRRGPGCELASVARVALLRDLAGLTYASIAERLASTSVTARRYYRLHGERLRQDSAYADVCARAAKEALEELHAPPGRRVDGNP